MALWVRVGSFVAERMPCQDFEQFVFDMVVSPHDEGEVG